jgi:2-polyprenyl-6-methoxyphenol hydroxylase-like FAD-dependent oxidoreductase
MRNVRFTMLDPRPGIKEQTGHSQVLIVGGGPVGMVLALFLDRYGVKSVVFNTEEGVRTHPRGNTHNSRTMEHYRRLGISDTVRKLGLPPDHPKDAAYFTRLSGWEIARYRMPSAIELACLSAATQLTDQIPEPMHRAAGVEDYLLGHLRKRSNVELRFGWEADQFSQDADGVGLMARRVTDGQSEQWRAHYLVGCDGGHSAVRRSLGIRYSGYDRLEQAFLGGGMISTYLRAPTLYRDYLGRRRAWMYWVVNPEVRSTLFTLNGNDEFMFYTKPKDPCASPDDAAVRHTLFRSIGAEVPVEFIGHQPWTAGAALVAERFADRRILLAGDAVHLFTPTGGFGMNTGIDDVANLSWKLAATLQGWGGKSLLDSYETERKPIAVRNTLAARAIAKQVGVLDIPARMEEDSPIGAEQRQEVGAQVSTYLATQFAPIGVELGTRYDGSSIISSDEAAPTDSIVQYIPTGQPGGRAPHTWLGPGRGIGDSLYDRLGNGFTLLRLGAKSTDAAGLAEAAKKSGVPLDILDVADAATRDLYGADLVLIRPDQHIAWRGANSPSDASVIMARVIGA